MKIFDRDLVQLYQLVFAVTLKMKVDRLFVITFMKRHYPDFLVSKIDQDCGNK